MTLKPSITTADIAALTGLSARELISVQTTRNGAGQLLLAVECFVLNEDGTKRLVGPKVAQSPMRATYYIPIEVSDKTSKPAVANATAPVSKRIVNK